MKACNSTLYGKIASKRRLEQPIEKLYLKNMIKPYPPIPREEEFNLTSRRKATRSLNLPRSSKGQEEAIQEETTPTFNVSIVTS